MLRPAPEEVRISAELFYEGMAVLLFVRERLNELRVSYLTETLIDAKS